MDKKFYYDEREVIKLIDYQVKTAKRLFRFIITNDDDDSYIPNFKSDFVICDCSAGEDFTRGLTWRKYFDECDDRPVLFINTSVMFQQFETYSIEMGVDHGRKGPGLWAQHMYEKFRDKMWKEKRTKFVFMVKDEDMTEMYRTVNAGFYTELMYYQMIKDNFIVKRDGSTDKLIVQPTTKEQTDNLQQDKVWKQDFSETLGFEYPNVGEVNGSMKNNSFLGCIEDMHLEVYEVPGLLPRESKIETGPVLVKKPQTSKHTENK